MAWGDYDGDGDLDLAVGNWGQGHQQPNRLYRNDGGVLTASAVWSSSVIESTESVTWGDYDGDGDLDLVAGNSGVSDRGQANRLYRNDGGTLRPGAVWSSVDGVENDTNSMAWGDYDGDGDLDLAAGVSYPYPNRLYRNNSGVLTPGAIWSATEADTTTSVAWGDYRWRWRSRFGGRQRWAAESAVS